MKSIHDRMPVIVPPDQFDRWLDNANEHVTMASALIAYLLVAAVSLLGVTVALWGSGIGPPIGN